MPIPIQNEHGFLPAGIHNCTLSEIKTRFGTFQGTNRRPELFKKLESFFAEATRAGIVQRIFIDGSFVTSVENPNDIDLLIEVTAHHDFSSDLEISAYNIVSKRRIHRVYGFDILVARAESLELAQWIEFFQQVRLEPALQKGILRVGL